MKATPYLRNQEIWAWAFYDFANSAFATSISAVIFNVYFVQVIVGDRGLSLGPYHLNGGEVWSFTLSLSVLIVIFIAPVLGAIADFSATKKWFLAIFCYLGAASTMLLALADERDIWWAVFFFICGNVGLEASLPFYNGFLLELSGRQELGKVSGFGWAIGYVGGLLCLVLNLLMIEYPSWFGIPERNNLPVRMAILVVGLWWAIFAVPLLLGVRERALAGVLPSGMSYVRHGFGRLYQTFSHIRNYGHLVKFLIAYLFYNDGIQTVLVMAAVFGAQVLGMDPSELILCFIMIQLVAFFGALIFGSITDKVGGKKTIQITLLIWSAAVLSALVITENWHFWVLGAIIGFVMGGSQSASRALFAQFTPDGKNAEFFSFFSICQKSSSVIGPFFFGLALVWFESTRVAVSSILVFFVAGMLFLRWVDAEEGTREAQR